MNADYTAQALLNQVFRARQANAVTYETLAEACRVSPRMVKAWEHGERTPNIVHFAALAFAVDYRLGLSAVQRLRSPAVREGEAQSAGDRPLRTKTARTLAARTPQRAADERAYLKRSREWLAGKVCARCGTSEGLTVQHMRGRRGRLLLDERWWLPLCWNPCHAWAEAHPDEAKAQGFADSKLGGAA